MSHSQSIETLVVKLREAREQLARLNEEVQAGLVAELSRLPEHFGYADVDAFAQAVRSATREVNGTPRRRKRRQSVPPPKPAVPQAPIQVQPPAPARGLAASAAPAAEPAPAPLPAPEEMPPALPANTGDSFSYRDALTAQREAAMRRLNDRATKPQAWIAWKRHLIAVDEALRASQ